MANNTQIHNIRIVERLITYPRNDRMVQHCVRGDTLRIAWDEEWNYMTSVVAIFVNAADGVRKTMDATSGECEIPWEVMQTYGRIYLLVIGYQGTEQRLVTQKMDRPFTCNPSGDTYDTLLPEVTEDVLQKLLAGADDIDEAIANANALAYEAQAIISAIHSQGFDNDAIWSALQTIAARLTYDSEDVWAVGSCLYASYDVIRIDGNGELYFVIAEIDEDDLLKIGAR